MLVRCPKCRTDIQLPQVVGQSRVTDFFCSTCQSNVRIDLIQDEVKSESSAGGFAHTEHKKKILVVDDESVICRVAEEILTSAGHEVLNATNGEQALRLVHDEHPDLILLDLVMPRMSGFEFIAEIRKNPRTRDTPILILSVLVSKKETDAYILELDVQGFIDKTEFVPSLGSLVQRLLSK
ncbi:MAG: response regulator [Planctomycetota bacterium]|jgi:CheY-like chemotaxis protein